MWMLRVRAGYRKKKQTVVSNMKDLTLQAIVFGCSASSVLLQDCHQSTCRISLVRKIHHTSEV